MKLYTYLTFVGSIFFLSCGSNEPKSENIFSSAKFDEAAFAENLSGYFSANKSDTLTSAVFSVENKLRDFYKQNEYRSLWLLPDGTTELADKLLDDLNAMQNDGLEPEAYHVSLLKEELRRYKSANHPATASVLSLDTSLTYNYLLASRELLLGKITPKKVDSLWFHANDSSWNMNVALRFLKENRYPSLDSFRSELPAYAILRKALVHYKNLAANDSFLNLKQNLSDKEQSLSDSIITSIITIETPWLQPISDTLSGIAVSVQAYQQFFGLKRTGKTDSATRAKLSQQPVEVINLIKANLERLRWLPRSFGNDYVIVNIPQMQMKLIREHTEVMSMNVVVGKTSRQTPVLNARMSNIVLNPPWGVPPTIAKKDVLPGILKSGNSYLYRKGLEAFDRRGKKIDAAVITTENYRRFIFKQPPGDRNALGYVKFNFPNKWDIYMHDTPHREDFDKFDRARSSGCIRLHHPQELAKYILTEMEGKNFEQDKIDSIIATHKTTTMNLKTKIPVHIVYLTACEDASGTHIMFTRDFYKRDEKLMEAISR